MINLLSMQTGACNGGSFAILSAEGSDLVQLTDFHGIGLLSIGFLSLPMVDSAVSTCRHGFEGDLNGFHGLQNGYWLDRP